MNERMTRAYIADLRREIAELKKDRDAWERRTRYLEAKRKELAQAEAEYNALWKGSSIS